ncbi:polysaccharide export protein, partial [Sulfurovum sp. bin170]|uniref:polysaccharide biosynthesis/export family protein n=1 Tax=Sulfurovum sp. bin170 TaxID=2695268 RepID=UPI0013E05150
MKRILIFLFLIEVLMGVDLVLDDNSNGDFTKKELQNEKIYFGKRLFQGAFKDNRQLKYSPNYLINIDDTVSIKLWGAYEYGAELKVDSRGNVFIPKVGTVHLLGVNSQELKDVVSKRVRSVFNKSVSVYANLNSYQPISIFVTGGVKKPGLYEGFSSDSVLQLIDKAGGIIDGEGSYRAVTVLRADVLVKRFDLYKFLLDGKLGLFQFRSGDVVKVDSLQNRIEVTGEVRRPYIFELNAESVTVGELMQFVLPKANVTHFMITHWSNGLEKVDKYPIGDKYRVFMKNGEKIHFISDYLKDNLSIEIDGEHGNLHTMTLQKGTTLKSLLSNIIMTPISDASAVQLYRKSIALRQKQLISANLRDLEARVLTTGSSTT